MKRKINEAPISYDSPERMDPSLQSKIEKGETPFSENPALPKSEPNSFEEIIASKRFKDVVEKVKRYTGLTSVTGQNAFMQLQMMLMNAVREVKSIENRHTEQLENLAIELVKKELAIPENAFQYDVQLSSSMGQVDTSKMRKSSEEPSAEEIEKEFNVTEEEAEEDILNFIDAFEKFDLEKAKRRFINSLIQGASKKGHYMFELISDELESIDERLLNLYGVLMSINDLLYWVMPDETMQMMSGSGQSAEGSTEVDPETDPPTIKAKGLFFPILVHEIIKGVYEVLGSQGLPDDPKKAEMVMASQDTLPYEIWDLRLGPVIWEKFVESYPDELFEDDMREIQNYLFSRFSMLTTEEFFEVAKMILSGSKEGKQIVKKMVDEIVEELRNEEYKSVMDLMSDEEDDDDLTDFLGSLGIGPSK
jgi:hypothetical protein